MLVRNPSYCLMKLLSFSSSRKVLSLLRTLGLKRLSGSRHLSCHRFCQNLSSFVLKGDEKSQIMYSVVLAIL